MTTKFRPTNAPQEEAGMLTTARLRGVTQPRPLVIRNPSVVERIISDARVLIIEGISGSGKDTFQGYLKKKLKHRNVYDFSEGEVLHSWKQLQIEGILDLRVKFMKLFINYARDIIVKDENAVFLLNRFHLSTYASTIVQQPKLEREYEQIISVLKMLPVHIFILQLDENEIEKRSLHPERSSAWQKFQQQIVENASFRDRLEKQQTLILEAAKRQQLPYSLIRLYHKSNKGDIKIRRSTAHRGVRIERAMTELPESEKSPEIFPAEEKGRKNDSYR